MVFLNLWDNLRSLPFFDLFNTNNKNGESKNLVFYSCFNYKGINWRLGYNSQNIKKEKYKKFIYYTGERFLDDINANFVIGFIPNNIKTIYKFDTNELSYNYLSDSELNYQINKSFDINVEKFNSNNSNLNSNNMKILTIDANKQYLNNLEKEISIQLYFKELRKHNSNKSKIYLQIRDQERTQLEYLFREKFLPLTTPDNVNIYRQNYYFDKIFNSNNNNNNNTFNFYDLESRSELIRFIEGNINIYRQLNIFWSKQGRLLEEHLQRHGNLYKIKPKFCCFIVSNPQCWQRNKMFELLSTYKQVDSMGRFMKNVDIIIPDRVNNQDEYYKLISQYKFMITFENHSLVYYNTEKIFNAFQSGTIPIYWGDPLIHKLYNNECFFNVEYNEDDDTQLLNLMNIVEKIKKIDSDDKLYIEMFKKKLITHANSEDNRLKQNMYFLMNI
jgi:hypothetical protein